MNIKDIMAIDIKKRIEFLTKDRSGNKRDEHYEQWKKEYDGEHKILLKPDKTIGDREEGALKTVTTAKEVLTLQKKIVSSAVYFLFGDPVQLVLDSDDEQHKAGFDRILEVLKDNKIKYFDKRLARQLFIETAVGELWYVRPVSQTDPVTKKNTVTQKIKVMLLSRENGSLVYPIYDETGDLIAISRKHTTNDLVEGKETAIEHVDTYTADTTYYHEKTARDVEWKEKTEPNLFGKIPVIFYHQKAPEWKDVQRLIDRFEEKMSSHADTDDYFDSPLLKIWGHIEKMPDKSDDGKLLMFKTVPGSDGSPQRGGDADYVTWDKSPESMKLEYEMLKYFILFLTDTPDIGFDNMKALGAMSGVAMKLMFMAAIGKAQDKQEIFGEAMMRRINLLKAMLGVVEFRNREQLGLADMEVSIKFGNPLPENIDELVTTLTQATGGESIMSQETAVRNNPLVTDANDEIEKLEKKRERTQAAETSFSLEE